MQKATLWAAMVALIACGGQATGVNEEEQVAQPESEMVRTAPVATPTDQDVIQIEVTSGGIGYSDKDSKPIPELTFGSPFNLTVSWVDPAVDSLTLSEFRLVAFDPTAFAADQVIWPPDPDYRLELQDQDGNPIRSVSFSSSDGASTTRTLILERVMTGSARDPQTPQLILFTVSARAGEREFVLDPPWAGKPPSG